jgi:hypothetical protein
MFFALKFELILIIGSNNVLTEGARKVPAGAALDRAGLENVLSSASHNPIGLHGLLRGWLYLNSGQYLTSISNHNMELIALRPIFSHKCKPSYIQKRNRKKKSETQ